uniref:Uncharacterized protein n=1 Tax=Oryza sativa subsp. japonica TaxID=39947 RepID=Q6Z288_ORYSJ|nr:hypothetical protein [Oryza sativa Japonica Group]
MARWRTPPSHCAAARASRGQRRCTGLEDATIDDELWSAVWMEDLLNEEDVATADEL